MQDWSDSPPPSSPPPSPPAPPVNPYAPPTAMGGPPPGGGPGGPVLPWLERSRIGWWTALVETIKLIVTQAREAFARVHPNGDYVSPFLYGMIITWVMVTLSQIYQALFMGAILGMVGAGAEIDDMMSMGGMTLVQIVVMAVLWPIFYPIVVLLSAGFYHLGLLIVGGLSNSPSRFEGTFNVVNYAQTATLANVIPILGGLLALPVQIYYHYVGFMEVHRTTSNKALIAALFPFVLCCVCLLGLFAIAGTAGFTEMMNQ